MAKPLSAVCKFLHKENWTCMTGCDRIHVGKGEDCPFPEQEQPGCPCFAPLVEGVSIHDKIAEFLNEAVVHKSQSKKTPWALGASNIKQELKEKFPGVTFKIVSKSFSGGSSIDVKWVDGPTQREVDQICDKYEYGTFDPMTDMSGYKENHDSSYGGAKYVHCTRNISPDFYIKIAREFGVTLLPSDFSAPSEWSPGWLQKHLDHNTQWHIENKLREMRGPIK